ncbi:MAG: lamin tail domain-containing protein [Verrucomicrobia bacterium]|nr:lamin tail domain-containing protein [Verrucomicrobiota bacterium]
MHVKFLAGCLASVCFLAAGVATSSFAAEGPATITTTPAGRTVFIGGTTTFSVVADGTAPLSYQWRKAGQPISGATAAALTLNNVQTADEAIYSVVVSNALGIATSSDIEFLVDPGVVLGTTTNTLVSYGATWKYNQSGTDLGTTWKDVGFNDTAWPSGPGILGLETAAYPDTIRTPLALGSPQVITYYFRGRFTATADQVAGSLSTTVAVDDGMVLYANGTEVARLRVPAGQNAATLAENQGSEGTPESIEIPASSLVVGENVLAAEVHQTGATSSDVAFGLTMSSLGVIRGPDNVRPTIISAGSVTNNRVIVAFSERLEPASATNVANYQVSGGIVISGAYMTNDDRTVALVISPIAQSVNYTLTVSNVRDRAVTPNTVLANSQVAFTLASGQFLAQDIGTPGQVGSVSAASGGYNITAGGTNIVGGSDQFTFNYQQVSGDFDYRVRVAGLTLADAWSRAGLMARETLQPNSRHSSVFATPSVSGSFFQWRSTIGGATLTSGSYPVNYPETWLRLKRAGNIFTGYASMDGTAWYQLGIVTNAMAPNVFLGMAVSAGVASSSATPTTTAQFRDFTQTTGATVENSLPDVEPAGPSSRRTPIAITEIMYNPLPNANSNVLEFIEVYNSNPYFEDISGWRLSGDIDYTFPANTILRAGEYRVIARVPGDVQAHYGISGVWGPYTNSLKETGTIRLRNKEDAVLLEIEYDNVAPWPASADGAGHSLVLARPSYGEGYVQAWGQSARVGGSPGGYDAYRGSPQRSVTINEFLANSETVDFVELYNHSNAEVDISGCTLSDSPSTNKFAFPANTKIPARGFLVVSQTELGFGLSSGGETIYLRSADATHVIDSIRFEAQALGVSSGRFPNGADSIYPLASPTPGAANAGTLNRDIVINEIMYKPISALNDDEYVEIYNRGAGPVNLTGWRFTSGIDFQFPSNTVLAADSYLVIAKNASRMLTNYPNLNSANTLGNYGGSLGNRGERVALAMPDFNISTNSQGQVRTNTVYVVVDEVTYAPGGQWSPWANEGGSSLELVDAEADRRLASNWADSDESAKSPWTTIQATDLMNNGSGTANLFEVLALGEGEYLVDDLELVPATSSSNFISQANSTFSNGQGTWQFRGTHIRSSVTNSGGFGGGSCLYLRASARGDAIHNRCVVPIPIPTGTVTLRAKVRWLRGWPEMLFRLHGNHAEATGRLALPSNLGTPGARNSRAVNNAAPAIYEVTHQPVVPAAGQAVVVTARVNDPDGIQSVAVRYRIDPATTYAQVAMNDAGTGGDAVAGDGVYSATIPGQAGGVLVPFYVQATDAATSPATVSFPKGASATTFECLVRFGDPVISSGFGTYRQWMTDYHFQTYNNRPALSNERVPLTFVYGNFRAIHFAAVKWAGSPYHQFSGNPNTTGHYSIDIPSDDLFLGTDNLNKVHAPGNGPFDDALIQREQTAYWFARQLGLPWNYRRAVNFYFNGLRAGGANQLMEDTETPGNSVVESRFSDDPDGNLYKLQPWFEVDDGNGRSLGFANARWCTLSKFTTVSNGVTIHKLAAYRNNFLARAVKGSANDYSDVFALVDAAETPAGPAHAANMDGIVDVEQWMRTFAVHHSVGDWDHFGSQNSQNMCGYKPTNGKWQLMIWDMNIVLGNSGSWAAGQNLFVSSGGGANMTKLYDNPKFRRMYLRALKELCNGAFLPANLDPVLDSKFAAYQASGVNATAPTSIKTFVSTARSSILGTVAAEEAAVFRITSTNNITTTNNLVTITGEAPVQVRTIWVNGIEYPVTWSNVKTFVVQVVVSEPTSNLRIEPISMPGTPIPGLQTNITVNYTGPIAAPESSLVINEVMYNPQVPDASYIEIFNNSSFAFDLTGWRVNGIDFTFKTGDVITNRQYMVIAKNRAAYTTAFPGAAAAAGQFEGNLDAGGETITLQRPTFVYSTNGTTISTNLVYVTVDKVKYDDDLPWPAGADGFGPSLQLIDASEDNSRVSNWADREDWRYVTYTGTIQGGASPGTNLLVFLNSAGDVVLDDLKLVAGTQPEVGPNLIANGGFEEPLAGTWSILGNHSNSVVTTEVTHSGNSAARVIAAGVGGASSAWRQFLPALPSNTVCTLSFWFKPSTNGSIVTIRTTPGSLFNSTNGFRPTLWTPGKANTVAQSLPAYDDLWVNELQVNNLTGIVDNQGEREPWIELYNAGGTTIDLSGYYLADNYTNLTQWQFPAGSTIAPGAFRIIWADGQPGQSSATDLHTNFRLGASTGSVALVRLVLGKPQVTDYLNYAGIAPDLSYGDFPNGQPFDRQVFFSVTPGAANEAREVNVFINEWMASNTNSIADPADADFDDWFELYNAGTSAVDLGGYWLSDSLLSPAGFQIPANGHYVIPAGGFLLVWADNEASQNSTNRVDLHVNFQLSRDGEQLGLFAPNGFTLIDGVSFGSQTNEISEGRFADGAQTRYYMTTPTPRGPNTIGLGNAAPTLAAIADRVVTLGQTVTLTAVGSDSDFPAQTLSYSVDAVAPAGATINGVSGQFAWTPTIAQVPSTNVITVRVTDNGVPALSAARSFTIVVRTPPRAVIANDGSGNVSLGFGTLAGKTYRVEFKDSLSAANWTPLGSAILANSDTLTVPDNLGANPQRFYRIVQLD